MRVLHITNWYPNPINQNEAKWIKAHIDSLNPHINMQYVFHLDLGRGPFAIRDAKSESLYQLIIRLPRVPWLIIEILSSILVFIYLKIKRVNKKYDIINFHIAYPNLTFWHLFKRWISIPVVITEHWSAYHYNFGVKGKLLRIRRIFQQNIPVIAISQALANDIKIFSSSTFKLHIIPNIVDTKVFKYSDEKVKRSTDHFFMVGQWKSPKRPMIVIKAMQQLHFNYPDVCLRIGGYGPMLTEMEKIANGHPKIEFLGVLNNGQVADEMSKAAAYLHPSDYETFSVVCAEAVTSGCPVIASNVGGIKEFITESNGILVYENTVEAFYTAMIRFLNEPISVVECPDFSIEIVGKKYFEALKSIINASDQ